MHRNSRAIRNGFLHRLDKFSSLSILITILYIFLCHVEIFLYIQESHGSKQSNRLQETKKFPIWFVGSEDD